MYIYLDYSAESVIIRVLTQTGFWVSTEFGRTVWPEQVNCDQNNSKDLPKGVDKSSKSAIIYTVTKHIKGVTICKTVNYK